MVHSSGQIYLYNQFSTSRTSLPTRYTSWKRIPAVSHGLVPLRHNITTSEILCRKIRTLYLVWFYYLKSSRSYRAIINLVWNISNICVIVNWWICLAEGQHWLWSRVRRDYNHSQFVNQRKHLGLVGFRTFTSLHTVKSLLHVWHTSKWERSSEDHVKKEKDSMCF